MSAIKNVDPEELMLFALQSLGAGEAAEVREHLEESPSARRDLAEIYGDLAGVALTTEMVTPAAPARVRFLKAVAEEQRAPGRGGRGLTAADVESGTIAIDTYRAGKAESGRAAVVPAERRGLGARVLPWAGWAVAAGMAFAAGELYRERQGLRETVAGDQAQLTKSGADAAMAQEVLSALNDQTSMRVTLTKQGVAASPTGRTTYSAEKGVLIFTASNMAPVDTFKVYELWLIPANGGAPIPAGTFHPDAKGYANLVSTEMPKGVEAKAFGITVEDDGGAKVPTPPILMTGA